MADVIYPLKFPEGIDPANNQAHRAKLEDNVRRWIAKDPEHRTGYIVDNIDMTTRTAWLARPRRVGSVTDSDDGRRRVNLSDDQMKANKGDEVAAMYEPRMNGWYLTEFHPLQGYGVLEKLDDDQLAARGAITRELKLKPWDARVTRAADGGWHVAFAEGVGWSSRMEAGMQAAVDAIAGRKGWWFEADAASGTVDVHPGELPTFLKSHPLPADTLGDPKWFERTPFGVLLPRVGGDPYQTAEVDWHEGAFLLAGGEGGSGKSVFANALIAEQIAQGVELSIIDTKAKSTDYFWCRPFVKRGFWGCESPVQAAGVLNALVAEMEHGERAKAWAENAWQSWYDIPDWAKRKFPIHVIVVDEYASLVDEAATVKTLPNPEKTLPPVIEQMYHGYAENLIRYNVIRILRLARFMGYRLMLFSQTINDRAGLGPTIRDLFTHRVVMGPNPSESLEKGAFHDLKTMPKVPGNIIDGGVSKGVGRGELAGATGRVFKTWWAGRQGMTDTEWYGRTLARLGFLPDWVDRERYFNTIAKHGPDDPVDAEYMRELTERISLPYEKAVDSNEILRALKDCWDESKMNFGGSGPAPAGPEPHGPSATPSPGPSPAPRPADDATLMDASELARLMGGAR